MALQVTWWACQRIIAAYAAPDPQQGRRLLTAVIGSVRRDLPAGLDELAQLGRTLHRHRDDVL